MRLIQYWNKVEKKYMQASQPKQLHCYNQNLDCVNRMGQNLTKYRIGI